MPFWRMIKEGSDHFEVTKVEPHVEVCDKRYVFDARAPGNASTPPVFHPREKCPPYEIPESIASAVKAKQVSDERVFAEHVKSGVGTVAVKTGSDGGMHPVFLAKLQGRYDLQSMTSDVKAPSGPLPANVNPPHVSEPEMTLTSFAAPTPTRSAQPGESTLGTISRWLGFSGSEATAAAPAAAPAAVPTPKAKPAPSKPAVAAAPAKPKPSTETAQGPSAASPAVH
jgi:hypothetical protein